MHCGILGSLLLMLVELTTNILKNYHLYSLRGAQALRRTAGIPSPGASTTTQVPFGFPRASNWKNELANLSLEIRLEGEEGGRRGIRVCCKINIIYPRKSASIQADNGPSDQPPTPPSTTGVT